MRRYGGGPGDDIDFDGGDAGTPSKAWSSCARGGTSQMRRQPALARRDIAECDAFEVVPSTGRRFTARDISVLNIVDGRLASWRDYWNPLEIIALGADYPTFSRGSLRVKPSCAELLHDSTRGLAPMGCRQPNADRHVEHLKLDAVD